MNKSCGPEHLSAVRSSGLRRRHQDVQDCRVFGSTRTLVVLQRPWIRRFIAHLCLLELNQATD